MVFCGFLSREIVSAYFQSPPGQNFWEIRDEPGKSGTKIIESMLFPLLTKTIREEGSQKPDR